MRVLTILLMVATLSCAKREDAMPPVASATSTPVPGDHVPTIGAIRCAINESQPPQLVVTVEGQVPTGGWTSPRLTPRTYATPPANGVWEYDFMAVKPEGMAAMMISPIHASHTWPDFPEATLRGIRVYGVDSGVKEVMLTACTAG